jgi:hypothetical protein
VAFTVSRPIPLLAPMIRTVATPSIFPDGLPTHHHMQCEQPLIAMSARSYMVHADGKLITHPDPGLVLANTDLQGLAHFRSARQPEILCTIVYSQSCPNLEPWRRRRISASDLLY